MGDECKCVALMEWYTSSQ